MTRPSNVDEYAANVLERINPQIRASFTEEQKQALVDAINSEEEDDSSINIRLMLPLYFISYYVAFQIGRDRRTKRQRVEHARRSRLSLLGNVLFFVFAASPIIILVLIALYFLKAALGIDLFPNMHTPNLFKF